MFSRSILTGQMRDTRRPVVAISLSGSKRSLSWTVGEWQKRLVMTYEIHNPVVLVTTFKRKL